MFLVNAEEVNVVSKMLNIGRAGLKTSEGWIAFITALGVILAENIGVDVPWEAISTVIVYIISRTVLKSVVARNGGK